MIGHSGHFISQNISENELANDINNKNVFVSHSVHDIDDLNHSVDDLNVFVNHFVNDFVNDFANVYNSTKSRNDNRKYSTKWTKLIENKSVVLSGVYLRPFCSTLLSKITSLLILNSNFFGSDKKTRSCFFLSSSHR